MIYLLIIIIYFSTKILLVGLFIYDTYFIDDITILEYSYNFNNCKIMKLSV